ncbi:MAG TPA: hypothetical protein VGM85_10575 [Paraburkholderia sp.]
MPLVELCGAPWSSTETVEIETRSRWRDRRLMALLAHRRTRERDNDA